MKPAIDILSLFPEPTKAILDSSILRRAQAAGLVDLVASSLRDSGEGPYKAVDDRPFGGSQGMLFRPEVLEVALQTQLATVGGDRSRLKVVYTSPRGARLNQAVAESFSRWIIDTSDAPRRICVLCGRYEGIDERVVNRWVDLELSLGDVILTGGELVALAFTDAVVRLLPGALGNEKSSREDSFSNGLLEYPQYTRPRNFMNDEVPAALLSGNHAELEEWKVRESLLLTAAFRPDLIRVHNGQGLALWAKDLLEILKKRCSRNSLDPSQPAR